MIHDGLRLQGRSACLSSQGSRCAAFVVGLSMSSPVLLPYLQSYPASLQQQAGSLLQSGKLGQWLLQRHPQPHQMRSDKALHAYVMGLKGEHMRNSAGLAKVVYDSKLQLVYQALGIHVRTGKNHGGKTQSRHEIRIGSLFKHAPESFLRMIAVHELAHLRESDHNKAFYQLCEYMEPTYHQLELEVRLYLTWLDQGGHRLWQVAGEAADNAV